MDLKDILKIATHPLVLASVGGWLVNRRYGSKLGSRYIAYGLGGAAGYLGGRMVQSTFFKAPAQTLLPPAEAPAASPSGKYVELDFTPQLAPPAALPAHQEPTVDYAGDSDGDFEGVFGMGSYDVSDVEKATDEAVGLMRARRAARGN